MSRTAVLFPGQGVQRPDMGETVRRWCPDLADRLEQALGADPYGRLREGTHVVQPAVYCASVAGWRALEANGVEADAFAGHSLGELAALVAAGSLDERDGLDLVVARGRITAEAGRRQTDGGMLAVMGEEVERVEEMGRAVGVHVANANSPRQTVLSGARDRLTDLAREAEGRGLRAVMLDVEGAFHSPAMAGVVDEFREHLDRVEFRPPRTPVYSGITTEPFEDCRRQLAEALTDTVRWRDLLLRLREQGIDTFVDAGPGRVLAGLVERTVDDGASVLTAKDLVRDHPPVRVARATAGERRPGERGGLRRPSPRRPQFARLGPPAMCAPPTVVANSEVAGRLGVDSAWIERRTGVCERRWAQDGERLSAAAADAGRHALARAGLEPEDLDLILVGTCTADEIFPNTAPLVAAELGAPRAAAMDVGSACTGFVSSMALAAGAIESGRATHALVIGADFMSRVTDRDDRRTAGLFADGAGAVTVSAGSSEVALGPVVLHTDSAGIPFLYVKREDGLLRMDGQETFKLAVRRMSDAAQEACERAEVTLEDIDVFVFHQANSRVLKAVGEELGLDPAKVVDCMDRFGNTSAATIPMAMCVAEESGLLRPGATVLSAAFGGGATYGAFVARWGAS